MKILSYTELGPDQVRSMAASEVMLLKQSQYYRYFLYAYLTTIV